MFNRKIRCGCGYEGRTKVKSRGSLLVGLVLLVLLFPVGIIYFIFKSGYRYYCPKCNMQVGIDS